MIDNQLDEWKKAAYELGAEHARNAASWVTDGNESDESRRRKLKMMDEGDPAILDLLPTEPNLSGEMSGDPTPQSLVTEITGGGDLGVEDESELVDMLANAYEEGVSETFIVACEAELRRWVT